MWNELPIDAYPVPAKWKGRSLEHSGEIETLTALAERVLKSEHEDVLNGVLAARNKPVLEPIAGALVLKDEESIQELLGVGAADESDAESCEEDLVEYRQLLEELLRARSVKQTASQKTTRKRKVESVASAASGSGHGTKIPFRVDDPMSLQESKKYWPPGARPSLDVVRFNRWKVEAPYLPEMVTK
eukprot:6258529-Amphidinium_carterae.1